MRNAKDGSVLVKLPAGEFMMGSKEGEGEDNEHPRHLVRLSGCWLGRSEVTWAQYLKFCGETNRKGPERPSWAGPVHPVVNVSWEAAEAYCAWAGLRLPTDRYSWGNEEPDAGGTYRANQVGAEDGFKNTAPTGSFPAGVPPFGGLDLAGNVWEWCSDWAAPDYYSRSAERDPRGPGTGTARVVRGGSWNSLARALRAAYRLRYVPGYWLVSLGFRVARSLSS
jgi:formylglycine-generating enzyme required for sulfatase activity